MLNAIEHKDNIWDYKYEFMLMGTKSLLNSMVMKILIWKYPSQRYRTSLKRIVPLPKSLRFLAQRITTLYSTTSLT